LRTILVTGPGGAGSTTVAAATAATAAREGARTLLIAAEPPSGLAEAGVPGLTVHTVDTGAVFRERAVGLQGRMDALFELLGSGPLDEEEFTELPGADAFALLRAIGTAAAYDVVVVDLPPLPRSLALLALPEQLRRYLGRLLPEQRQAARALRPVLAQLAGVPMPAEWLYETAARWDAELAVVQAAVDACSTSVRLVVEPGALGNERVRAARAGLALFGLRLESVTANRMLPSGSADPFLAGLADRQRGHLGELRRLLADGGPGEGVPDGGGIAVHEAPHLGREPHGVDDLGRLGVAGPGRWDDLDDAPARDPWSVTDRLAAEGDLLWRLPLPGAARDRLDLVRRGDELVVDAEGLRRIMPLPSALRRCTVAGAALRDGALQVRFAPDPALWPR
jgi:arsenite/tail-anchored protein-transporting ATPase